VLALVDLDETLVDRQAGFATWARGLAEEHGLDAEAMAWLRATDRAIKERGAFFAAVTDRLPQVGAADRLWERYRSAMPELTPAFPGVAQALMDLRDVGWRLGVVSNGRSDNQRGKLARTGLLDLFDAVCISEETGVRKPERVLR